MLQNILTMIFGTKSQRDTKALLPIVDEINTIYETLKLKSDEELVNKTLQFKDEVLSKRKEAEEYANDQISDKEELEKFLKDKGFKNPQFAAKEFLKAGAELKEKKNEQ